MSANIEEAKADYLAAKQAIGRSEAKILFLQRFKLETKHDKGDIKILAITSSRVYVVTKKQQSKIDFTFHILELHSLDASKPMVLNLVINSNNHQLHHTFLFALQEDADKTISYIMALLKSNFLNAGVDKQVSVKLESQEREELVHHQSDLIAKSLYADGQPCGSFSIAYMCMCDYYNQTTLPEVVWDINKILSSHSCKDFKIEDFDHLEPKELVPLIAALAYNTWFTRLVVSSYKLTTELVDVLIKVIQRSLSIEDFVLVDTHINKDQLQRISLALSANPHKVMNKLDISKNNLEDRGVSSLSGSLSTFHHDFVSLNLSDVAMTSKGASLLGNALKTNKHFATCLKILNLSGNLIKAEGAQSFCDFLAQPNALVTLNLANTDSALDLIFGALLRGSQQYMQNLSLSGNPFSYRKSKENQSLPSFQQFFSSCRSLKSADLSNTKFPAQAVKAILIGLLNNPTLTEVDLDISRNDLKSAGASEICSVIKDVRCLSKLNLADNGLDQDLAPICEAIQNSTSIKELDIARNVSKSKYNNIVAEALAEMVMSETLPLEKLSIADCKLRLDSAAVFDCLGTNETIIAIDISGNAIGDIGARLLAKALQINTKLQVVHLDKNNITYKGLQDIAYAMDRNYSLHSIPLPMTDLTANLKHNSEAFTKYYKQIENALIRNQSSEKYSPEHVFKVHQGLHISSVDHYTQSTDAYVVELQDLVFKHKNSQNENTQHELKVSKCLIKEVDSFRQALLQLFTNTVPSKKLLNEKFSEVANDVADSLEFVIQKSVDSMLNSAKEICPIALNNEEKLNVIKKELAADGLVDKVLIYNSMMQVCQGDVMYKLSESNLSIANSVAECLKKLLVDALRTSINKLSALSEEITESDTVVETQTEITTKETEVSISVENEEGIDDDEEKDKEEDTKEDEEKKEERDEKKVKEKPVEEDDGKAKETEKPIVEDKQKEPLTPSTPGICISSSAEKMLGDIASTEASNIPWEFSAGKRISVLTTDISDNDDETSLVAHEARNRLSALATVYAVEQQKQKKVSLKRRPTILRHAEPEYNEIEIPIDTEKLSIKEKSASNASNISSSAKSSDEKQTPRDRLVSVGAMDALASNVSRLTVAKDRAKPVPGRRPPSRVSNLAHLNAENTDIFLEESTKASPDQSPKPSPKRPPRERPLSITPASNVITEKPQRACSEKIKQMKAETPRKSDNNKKPESKKDKKGKSPVGGIQLPSLTGFLKRKDRSASKNLQPVEVTTSHYTKIEEDANKEAADIKPKMAAPVEPAVTKTESVQKSEKVERDQSTIVHEESATESTKIQEEVVEQPKPEYVKRPLKVPMVGGSALLVGMKKRQAKPEEKPAASAAKPKPPVALVRPGSVSKDKKPPRPKRPPSLKRPNNEEGKLAEKPEKPKPVQRPKKEEVALKTEQDQTDSEKVKDDSGSIEKVNSEESETPKEPMKIEPEITKDDTEEEKEDNNDTESGRNSNG